MAPPHWTAQPHGAIRKRPRNEHIFDQDWECRRDSIVLLYMAFELEDVMRMMAESFAFIASKQQYKNKIREWQQEGRAPPKHIKREYMRFMVARRRQRRASSSTGKETAFLFHGRPVDPKKLNRFESQSRGVLDKTSTPTTTPNCIGYHTPSTAESLSPLCLIAQKNVPSTDNLSVSCWMQSPPNSHFRVTTTSPATYPIEFYAENHHSVFPGSFGSDNSATVNGKYLKTTGHLPNPAPQSPSYSSELSSPEYRDPGAPKPMDWDSEQSVTRPSVSPVALDPQVAPDSPTTLASCPGSPGAMSISEDSQTPPYSRPNTPENHPFIAVLSEDRYSKFTRDSATMIYGPASAAEMWHMSILSDNSSDLENLESMDANLDYQGDEYMHWLLHGDEEAEAWRKGWNWQKRI